MEDTKLSLNWQCHRNVLMTVFEHFLENNILLDCTLAAEGQCLKAHKVILAASSRYFQLLLSQEIEKHPIIILKDVKFQELKALLEFIYKGEVVIPEEKLRTFLNVANSLEIKGLKSHVEDETRKAPTLSAEGSVNANSSLTSTQRNTGGCHHFSQDCCDSHQKVAVSSQKSNLLTCQQTNGENKCVSQDFSAGHSKKAVPSHKRKWPSCEQTTSESRSVSEDVLEDCPRKAVPSPRSLLSCQPIRSECGHRFQDLENNLKKALQSHKGNFPCCQQTSSESGHIYQVCLKGHSKRAVPRRTCSPSYLRTTSECDHFSQGCFECHHKQAVSPQKNMSPSCQQISNESEHEHGSQDCLENHCQKAVPRKSKSPSCQSISNENVRVSQGYLENNYRKAVPSQKCPLSGPQTNSECGHISKTSCESHHVRTVSPQNNISPSYQQNSCECIKKHTSQDCLENQHRKTISLRKKKSQSCQQTCSECVNVFQFHFECNCKTAVPSQNNRSPSTLLTNSECSHVSEVPIDSHPKRAVLTQNNTSAPCQQTTTERDPEHISQDGVESCCETADPPQMYSSPSQTSDNCISRDCLEVNLERSSPSVCFTSPMHQEDCEAVPPSTDVPVLLVSQSTHLPQNSICINEQVQSNMASFPVTDCVRKMCVEPSENIENFSVNSDTENQERINDSVDLQNVNGASEPAFHESSPIKESGLRISSIHCATDSDLSIFNFAASETCKNADQYEDRQLSHLEMTFVVPVGEEPKENEEYFDEEHSYIPRKRIRMHKETETLEIDGRNVVYVPGASEDSPANIPAWSQENSTEHFYESDCVTEDNMNRNYVSDGDHLSKVIDTPGIVPLVAATISVRRDLLPSDIQNSSQLKNISGSAPPIKSDLHLACNDLEIKEEPMTLENIQENSAYIAPEILMCNKIDIKEKSLAFENTSENSPLSAAKLECDEIEIKEEPLQETESELEPYSEPSVSQAKEEFRQYCAQEDGTHTEKHCDNFSNPPAAERLEIVANKQSVSDTGQEAVHESDSSPSEAKQKSELAEGIPKTGDLTCKEVDIAYGLVNLSYEVFEEHSNSAPVKAKSNGLEMSVTTVKSHEKLSPASSVGMEKENYKVAGREEEHDTAVDPETIACQNIASGQEHHCEEMHSNTAAKYQDIAATTHSHDAASSQDTECCYTTPDSKEQVAATISENQDTEAVTDCDEYHNTANAFECNGAKSQKLIVATEHQNNAPVSEPHYISAAGVVARHHVEIATVAEHWRTGAMDKSLSVANVEDDHIIVAGKTVHDVTTAVENHDSVNVIECNTVPDKCNFSSAAEDDDDDDDDDDDEDENELASKGHWHTCQRCGKNFAFTHSLRKHQWEHKRDETCRCTECGKIFPSLHVLERHKVIHIDHPCKCNECGKIFRRRDHLQQHQQLHMREHSFKCQQCGKAFLHSDHLLRHQQESHPGTRSYICNECRMAFTNARALTMHQQLHLKQRSHKCQECGKAFLRSEYLRRHQLVHMKDKP